jgi:putative ABC transport system substrate-binding protein
VRLNHRVIQFGLVAILLSLGFPAEAQQPKQVPRIGYLTGTSPPTVTAPDTNADAFRQGLRDLGYDEGKNILIEYRSAEEKLDHTRSLVAELTQLKVDVLVSGNLTAIRAAKQVTTKIPIVMVTQADPVATGLIDSLARPGRNITGLTTLSRELSGKRLEIIQDIVPRISRVAVLWDADSEGARYGAVKEYEVAAHSLRIPLQPLEVRGPNPDFEAAFEAAVKGRASALILARSVLLGRYPKRIAELAIQNRFPQCTRESTM